MRFRCSRSRLSRCSFGKAADRSLLLNPAECASSENDRQPEQDDCDRHERRAGDISEQDEENRDDGEDCCDVVVHSFPIVYRVRLSGARFLKQNRCRLRFSCNRCRFVTL
jgi:hypothetical protein